MTDRTLQTNTHRSIDPRLVGVAQALGEGSAEVALETCAEMAADARGLVHGGFVFGAADYAAMLAVNDPHVVLGSAEVRFLAPVRVGERVTARARVTQTEGRKHTVEVDVDCGGTPVLRGTLLCFVLEQHVLARREEPEPGGGGDGAA